MTSLMHTAQSWLSMCRWRRRQTTHQWVFIKCLEQTEQPFCTWLSTSQHWSEIHAINHPWNSALPQFCLIVQSPFICCHCPHVLSRRKDPNHPRNEIVHQRGILQEVPLVQLGRNLKGKAKARSLDVGHGSHKAWWESVWRHRRARDCVGLTTWEDVQTPNLDNRGSRGLHLCAEPGCRKPHGLSQHKWRQERFTRPHKATLHPNFPIEWEVSLCLHFFSALKFSQALVAWRRV